MQHRKTLFSRILLAAAILLAVVLGFCIVPVWNYIVGRTTPLEELYPSGTAVSAVDVSITDEAVQSLLDGSVTLDEFYAQLSLAAPAASASDAEAAVSSSDPSAFPDTSQPAEDSSAGTSSVSVSASSSSSSSSVALEPSSTSSAETPAGTSSSSATKDPTTGTAQSAAYEQEIKALIQQLYGVKARAESGLNQCIQSATAEYRALPPEKQTQAKKVSICFSKAGQLSALQASCDKEVSQIVSEMRRILRENGQSTALADSAEATYKNEKSAMYSTLMSRLYS